MRDHRSFVSVVLVVTFVSAVSFRSFRWFRSFRFDGFVLAFRVLVHAVCEAIKKCEKCGQSMEVRKLNSKNHICGKKCSTCGVVVDEKENHKCYIQKTELKEESQYNELLFFYLECTQEEGIHKANLCIVHDEAGREKLFRGNTTIKDLCEWLFTKEHMDCIVIAHNFQGYDGYFIQNYLNKNAVVVMYP